jgi:protein involved in polysaccharide export with SLBB domain
VRLTRGGQAQVLDLQGLALGDPKADPAANLAVQPGDTLMVPESENRVYLLGEVVKPDAYPLREGERLFDVLTRAGGPSPQANTAKAMLMRRDEHGQPVPQPLDLSRMLSKGDMRQNMALQPGDVILIPGKNPKKPGGLSGLATLFLPFAGLFNVFGR